MKNKLIVLFFLSFLLSCEDLGLHKEVLLNINSNSKYALYEKNADIKNKRPLKSGVFGEKFFNCFYNAKRIFNLGATDRSYYFEVFGENGTKYYYDLKTTNNQTIRLSRWKRKTEYGYEDSGSNYSMKCALDDLMK